MADYLEPYHPFWIEGILIALGMTAQILFILTRTDNFGGKAYGNRFFIPLLPFLFYFIIFGLPTNLTTLKAKLAGVGLAILGIPVYFIWKRNE